MFQPEGAWSQRAVLGEDAQWSGFPCGLCEVSTPVLGDKTPMRLALIPARNAVATSWSWLELQRLF